MTKKKSSDKKKHDKEPLHEAAASEEQIDIDAEATMNQEGEPPEEKAGDGEREESTEEIIAGLEADLKTANERFVRLMAEFDNYKKRTSREYERLVESANEKLMIELIEVRETFERALKHTENADLQSFVDGTKLIFNKFDAVLAANGLTPFAEVGEEFDPQLHDAMLKQPHPELEEDHIVDIFEKGYKLKDRVIKHARVIVSAGAPEEEPETAIEKE